MTLINFAIGVYFWIGVFVLVINLTLSIQDIIDDIKRAAAFDNPLAKFEIPADATMYLIISVVSAIIWPLALILDLFYRWTDRPKPKK